MSRGREDDLDPQDAEAALRRTADRLPEESTPAWLTTKLTAEFRRRHGQGRARREHRLLAVHDSRDARPVGARGAGDATALDFTLHLAAEHDAPEVVLDVRPDADVASVDGLVLHGGDAAYHVRAELGDDRVDADTTSRDGRFSFRGLPRARLVLTCDDGDDVLVADVDLSEAGRP